MTRRRDATHRQQRAVALNPPRIRRADRRESVTVSTAPRPARCSRCHALREAGQLVQDGGSLVCEGGCSYTPNGMGREG